MSDKSTASELEHGAETKITKEAPVEGPAPLAPAVSRSARVAPRALTPATALTLQRVVGNRTLQRLLSQTRTSTIQRGTVQPAVQRRALIGPALAVPSAAALLDPAVATVHNDADVRRFKDEAELREFAGGGLTGMGMLPGTHDWVRLDGRMLVLGEDHGNPLAPAVIQATRVRNYRYEGFAHHSGTRKENSTPLRARIAASDADQYAQKGLAAGVAEPTHDAEHALPKYARVLPDVQELIARQAQGAPAADVSGTSVVAGAQLVAPYSLAKALLKGLLSALVYAKSYGGKFWGHVLKTFYNGNAAAVDTAITQMNADLSLAVPVVTNFAGLAVTPLLGTLATAYETAARDKLKLGTRAKRDAFKAKLNLASEPDVALTPAAKENDYLRDKSMYDTVKKAAAAGDRLFVIGDAHRHKLQPLLESEGFTVMKDTDFVNEQKRSNRDAGGGVTADDRAQLIERAKKIYPRPKPNRIGATFTLETPANCAWAVTGVTPTATPGEYTISSSEVRLTLMWTVSGVAEEIHKISYSNMRR